MRCAIAFTKAGWMTLLTRKCISEINSAWNNSFSGLSGNEHFNSHFPYFPCRRWRHRNWGHRNRLTNSHKVYFHPYKFFRIHDLRPTLMWNRSIYFTYKIIRVNKLICQWGNMWTSFEKTILEHFTPCLPISLSYYSTIVKFFM